MNVTKKMRRIASVALLGLLTVALGCADLDVENPNAPDRDRALNTAGDVESLISGSFHTWWNTANGNNLSSIQFILSGMSFQHSAWPANGGNVFYSSFPRPPVQNNPANEFYSNFADPYEESYSMLSAVRSGLQSINENEAIRSELGASAVARDRAVAKFMQGLGHATVALVYDQGFVLDENVEDAAVQSGELEPVPYDQLMNQALSYLDEAASIAESNSFTVPAGWMSREVSAAELAGLAHTMKARYMAAVARNPQEREAVDWNAVLTELNAGVDSFTVQLDPTLYSYEGFETDMINYWSFAAWQQLSYFIHGMADQSGDYQAWLQQPIASRGPDVDGDPVLIQTPDTRYPQGSTLQEQINNPGEYFAVPDPNSTAPGADFSLASNFQQPGRGVYRWSYYYDTRLYPRLGGGGWNYVTAAETRLLRAEAQYRLGNPGQAAQLINVSRTAHGLNQTDASGTNSSCVPRLPNGDCGGLLEMLKWEKRLETQYRGLLGVPWYFEGRGWGELYGGSPVHWPLPAQDANLLGITPYTFGGCGQDGGASGSPYAWPDECGGG